MAHAQVVIDGFDDGAINAAAAGSGGVAASSAIGGDRVWSLSSDHQTLELVPGNGFIDWTHTPSAFGSTASLIYGASAPLNLDLTGEDRFLITFSEADRTAADTRFILTVETATGNIPSVFDVAGPGTYELPFSGFTGGADFARIDRIVVTWFGGGGGAAESHRLDSIIAVPAPAAPAAAGLGVIALAAASRRRTVRH